MVSDRHIHRLEMRTATLRNPYHFVDSGLPNVYLSGIKYRVCRACEMQSADIPALKQLMMVLARAVVESEAPLTGLEIRFLRKRLGKKATEFAQIIGVSQEQVSRWENEHNLPEKATDNLIRIYYSIFSKDRELKRKFNQHIEEMLTALRAKKQLDKFRAKLTDGGWRVEPVRIAA